MADNISEYYKALVTMRTNNLVTSYKERQGLLAEFQRHFFKWRPRFQEAIEQDLGRDRTETDLVELMPILLAFKHVRKNLKKWMRPKRMPTPFFLWNGSSKIVYEPKGVVLIIAPWNYPLSLSIIPLLDALAAGNRVIIKPSEMTPATSEILKQFAEESFSTDQVTVFTGGRDTATALLELPFDHILFTGSPGVGKVVMAAAAKHLTPVTLELGGKCPVIVDRTADLKRAAKKIMWAKQVNAGQTCIAPDYVLVDRSIENQFMELLIKAAAKQPALSQPIINSQHFERIHRAFQESVKDGAQVEIGGIASEGSHSLSLTVLRNAKSEHAIMKEEIFGPVLPVMAYDDIEEATQLIRQGEKPLALYIFTKKKELANWISSQVQSGGVCVNDLMLHFVNPAAPFGGIGASGMGQYHGVSGFLSFSHQKTVFTQSRLNFTKVFYPPYWWILKKFLGGLLR